MTDTILLLYIHKRIFIFLFYNCRRAAMSRKDHQIIVERIQLLTNRGDDLFVAAALEVCASDATIEEGIAAEDTVGMAHQAHAAGRVAGRLHNFKRERPEREAS